MISVRLNQGRHKMRGKSVKKRREKTLGSLPGRAHAAFSLQPRDPTVRSVSEYPLGYVRTGACVDVTPSIQSYTNHTRKCVRSRSRTHGKISQHNSRHKLKIIQALYYKPGASRARIHSSKTQESAEATISEYRHKLDKFALRRLTQK